ncbi:MAG: hypothetical protein NC087_05320 [Anaeroplasma bactoclasticum]|nr:hypothetical protein [Anaeroplasma bactoclasticum]
MKDTLLKLTVRLYDSTVINRLDTLWEQVNKIYSVKNAFICDVLLRGIESLENEQANVKEMIKSGNIFNELKRLTNMLSRFVDVGYEHYKESYVVSKENRTLISRLYDIIFKIAEDKGISIDDYNDGLFDELPENFEAVTDMLIKEFEKRANT